jgi:hypothetical protein
MQRLQRSNDSLHHCMQRLQRCNDQEPIMSPDPSPLSSPSTPAAGEAQAPPSPTTVDLLSRVVAVRDLERRPAMPVSWFWYGYLGPGKVTLLTSQWKSGKTTLLALLLARMQSGGVLAG